MTTPSRQAPTAQPPPEPELRGLRELVRWYLGTFSQDAGRWASAAASLGLVAWLFGAELCVRAYQASHGLGPSLVAGWPGLAVGGGLLMLAAAPLLGGAPPQERRRRRTRLLLNAGMVAVLTSVCIGARLAARPTALAIAIGVLGLSLWAALVTRPRWRGLLSAAVGLAIAVFLLSHLPARGTAICI